MSDFREELIDAMATKIANTKLLRTSAREQAEAALDAALGFRQTVECPDCGGTGDVVERAGDVDGPTVMSCPAGCIDGRVPGETRLAIVERQVGWWTKHSGDEHLRLTSWRYTVTPIDWERPVFLLAPDLPETEK